MIVPPPNQGPANPQSSSEGLSPGAIAGIVIGVVLFLIIVGYLIWRWWRSTHIQLGDYPNAVLEIDGLDDDEKVSYTPNPAWAPERHNTTPTPILGRNASPHNRRRPYGG